VRAVALAVACFAAVMLPAAGAAAKEPGMMQPAETPPPPMINETGKKIDRENPDRFEWSIFPFVSASTDTGVLFGALAIIAQFREGYTPYRWRGQFQLSMSIMAGDGGVEFPLMNHFIRFDFPDLLKDRLRLYTNLAHYHNSVFGWYGLGDASSSVWKDSRTNEYSLTEEIAALSERTPLGKNLFFLSGIRFKYISLTVYSGSRLEQDQNKQAPGGGPLVRGVFDHAELQFSAGLQYDNRDFELNPGRGMLHEFSLRYSPGALGGTKLDYGGATLGLRFYQTIIDEYLVFACRLYGDVLFGAVPFTELGRAGAFVTYEMPGGSDGVRGVPLGRFSGKLKTVANFELRSMFLRFTVLKQKFKVGAAAFFDTGRVWSDWSSPPSLDGTGFGMKYGAGGGIRLQWGSVILVRIDVAYSPNATDAGGLPVGIYAQAGQLF
jgi:outer membrane protein assembly factor BamA